MGSFFIETIDDALMPNQVEDIFQFVKKSTYVYGVTDNKDTPPTGLISYDALPTWFLDIVESHVINPFNLNHFKVCQSFINMFGPKEDPFFHTDIKNGVTIVYYCNNDYQEFENGETQFIVYDEKGSKHIKGILPIPGRFVIFSGGLRHRATSFRTKHRFTIALQLGPKENSH